MTFRAYRLVITPIIGFYWKRFQLYSGLALRNSTRYSLMSVNMVSKLPKVMKEGTAIMENVSSDGLNELLSDTGDWDTIDEWDNNKKKTDRVHVAPKHLATQNIQPKTGLSSDDYDDDLMILDMFDKKPAKKIIRGASAKVTGTFLRTPQEVHSSFPNSFNNPPIGKSTQIHNSLKPSIENSVCKRNMHTEIHRKIEQILLESQHFEPIEINNDIDDGPLFVQSQLKALNKDPLMEGWLEQDFDKKNEIEIPIMDKVKLEEIKKQDKDTYSIKAETSTRDFFRKEIEEINPKEEDTSLEIIDKPQDIKYGVQFRLLTQRQAYTDMEDTVKNLNLPPNTKVKIPIRLSKEQEDVIKLAEQGHNIFYTGSAGTGKSILLREMIKILKLTYGSDRVAVTASTGLAACNIGGITVHSFAGIGLGNGDEATLYKKVRRSRKHLKRWQQISTLVIDEISMLNGGLLDKLDYIAKKIRKNQSSFGGIQLIFCGDFFQLPPVSKDNNPCKFAFESDLWRNGIDVTIMLQKVFRQQGDSKFIDMLNKMRLGQIDEETEIEFKKLSRPLENDEIIPAELYSTRYEVERANNSRLDRLPGNLNTYYAIDGGSLEDDELKEKLLSNFLAPKQLKLKIGAQVMMVKNVDATLVNGSLGKVIDFIDPETYMFYETIVRNPDLATDVLEKFKDNPKLLKESLEDEEDGDENCNTVRHKLTKAAFCRDDENKSVAQLGDNIFDFLMDVSGDTTEMIENLQRKRALLKEVHESSTGRKKLPLVRFKTSDLATRTVLIEPEDWCIEDENEQSLVSRVQLPLMLAWSLSIHKSQGQTLPKVKVDLKKVFEKGQAYVALSRAVSREGLQVLNFDKTRILAHEKVIEFYGTLLSADDAIKQLNENKENLVRRQPALNFAPKFTAQFKRQKSTYQGKGNKLGGNNMGKISEGNQFLGSSRLRRKKVKNDED